MSFSETLDVRSQVLTQGDLIELMLDAGAHAVARRGYESGETRAYMNGISRRGRSMVAEWGAAFTMWTSHARRGRAAAYWAAKRGLLWIWA